MHKQQTHKQVLHKLFIWTQTVEICSWVLTNTTSWYLTFLPPTWIQVDFSHYKHKAQTYITNRVPANTIFFKKILSTLVCSTNPSNDRFHLYQVKIKNFGPSRNTFSIFRCASTTSFTPVCSSNLFCLSRFKEVPHAQLGQTKSPSLTRDI